MTYTQRILQLMEYWINQNKGIQKDFLIKIGVNPNNVSKYKNGDNDFTPEQITEACKLTGASADWVLGLTKEMFRTSGKKTSIAKIKEALRELEESLKVKT